MRKIAAYVRVSTADQSLDRQYNSIDEYARRTFDTGDVEYYEDKSTGTDTARDGYRDLMDAVLGDEYDAVIAHQVSRVARSISDLERTAERFREHKTALHIVSEGLKIEPGETDPYQNALFQLLGVFAELEAEITRSNIREGLAARRSDEDYWHGPAPLGFVKRDGQLVEAPEYNRVVTVLEGVVRGDRSIRGAAEELETSRRTIQRSLYDEDRSKLYGFESNFEAGSLTS